jgi:hypothetical protein
VLKGDLNKEIVRRSSKILSSIKISDFKQFAECLSSLLENGGDVQDLIQDTLDYMCESSPMRTQVSTTEFDLLADHI